MNKIEAICEFLRYAVVGSVAFLADFGALIAAEELFFHSYAWGIYASTAVGFVVGLSVNYFLSLLFVFIAPEELGKGRSLGAFLLFGVIGLLGLVWTELGMYLGVRCLGLYYMVVKVLVTGAVLMWNYLARKLLVFR